MTIAPIATSRVTTDFTSIMECAPPRHPALKLPWQGGQTSPPIIIGSSYRDGNPHGLFFAPARDWTHQRIGHVRARLRKQRRRGEQALDVNRYITVDPNDTSNRPVDTCRDFTRGRQLRPIDNPDSITSVNLTANRIDQNPFDDG